MLLACWLLLCSLSQVGSHCVDRQGQEDDEDEDDAEDGEEMEQEDVKEVGKAVEGVNA